ncbi:MAG TPA: alpha/beta hydrolase [Bacteroidales bacterium]|nr:alpha/beta hydrolase [Bacteroidales bacterium]
METKTTNPDWEMVQVTPTTPKFTVLFLPGLLGSDQVFSKLMQSNIFAGKDIRLIAGNPPGFKGLPTPEGFSFSIESYALLYENLAKAEKVDLMVGHSYSGNVLIEVAARKNFKGKLMLISPSLYRKAETREVLMIDSFSRKKLLSGIIWWLSYQMMTSLFKPYFADKAELALAVKNSNKIPRPVARKVLLQYFNHLDKHQNLAKRLTTTSIPVCYLRGSLDDIKFTEVDKKAILESKLISYVDVEGARHFAMVDKPDEVARAIIDFLES